MKSFWIDKPVNINDKISQILDRDILLKKITNDLDTNKIQLDYNVFELHQLTDEKISNIINFIDVNYVSSYDNAIMYKYSKDLFKFCMNDGILLEFYPKNKTNVIGYILGKKCQISLYQNVFDSALVNFLCILLPLRNIGISSYMINVLTKEIILHYPTIIGAHYTISSPIKSPYFGMKKFYHRIINVPNLCKAKFITDDINEQTIINFYNKFIYKFQFKKKHTIKYINGEVIDIKLINELYDKYITYANKTYDIYEKIDLNEFKKTFENKAFHHFIIYKKDKIESYVCFFQLDSYNYVQKHGYSSGFYYYMFFNDNEITNHLEYINEYIYKNKIFDLITFSDIFPIDYKKSNYIEGSGFFKYYLYNVTCPSIENNKNGIVII